MELMVACRRHRNGCHLWCDISLDVVQGRHPQRLATSLLDSFCQTLHQSLVHSAKDNHMTIPCCPSSQLLRQLEVGCINLVVCRTEYTNLHIFCIDIYNSQYCQTKISKAHQDWSQVYTFFHKILLFRE